MASSVIYQIKVPNVAGPSELLRLDAPRTLANLQWTQCPSGEDQPYSGYYPEVVQLESGKLFMGFLWRFPSDVSSASEYRYAHSLSDASGMVWDPPQWAGDAPLSMCVTFPHDGADYPPVSGSFGLTSIRPGLLTINPPAGRQRWFASDNGGHWDPSDQAEVIPNDLLPGLMKDSQGNFKPWQTHHPILIDRDSSGNVTRWTQTLWYEVNEIDPEFPNEKRNLIRAGLWHSYPGNNGELGQTWDPSSLVLPKEWIGVGEVCLVRAKNGDLVAAVRTKARPNPMYPCVGLDFDEFSGLGFSRSTDNGATWSEVWLAYPYGRYHSSLVVLNDGTIVCCHVVNHAYLRSSDGLPRFGVEAIVSRNHGMPNSWDFDHRYILGAWKGRFGGNPEKTYFSGARYTS